MENGKTLHSDNMICNLPQNNAKALVENFRNVQASKCNSKFSISDKNTGKRWKDYVERTITYEARFEYNPCSVLTVEERTAEETYTVLTLRNVTDIDFVSDGQRDCLRVRAEEYTFEIDVETVINP